MAPRKQEDMIKPITSTDMLGFNVELNKAIPVVFVMGQWRPCGMYKTVEICEMNTCMCDGRFYQATGIVVGDSIIVQEVK